jgi:hypothetical protein
MASALLLECFLQTIWLLAWSQQDEAVVASLKQKNKKG